MSGIPSLSAVPLNNQVYYSSLYGGLALFPKCTLVLSQTSPIRYNENSSVVGVTQSRLTMAISIRLSWLQASLHLVTGDSNHECHCLGIAQAPEILWHSVLYWEDMMTQTKHPQSLGSQSLHGKLMFPLPRFLAAVAIPVPPRPFSSNSSRSGKIPPQGWKVEAYQLLRPTHLLSKSIFVSPKLDWSVTVLYHVPSESMDKDDVNAMMLLGNEAEILQYKTGLIIFSHIICI